MPAAPLASVTSSGQNSRRSTTMRRPTTPVKKAPAKSTPRASSSLELYVCRSGPRRGDAQLEAAFLTRPEAVAFLVNVHGLGSDEQKALAREGRLSLNPRWHGSETCAIRAVKMPKADAARALSGDLYL